MPTRIANAHAILLLPEFPSGLRRSMKNKAVPKLPMMAINARMTKYFMERIIS